MVETGRRRWGWWCEVRLIEAGGRIEGAVAHLLLLLPHRRRVEAILLLHVGLLRRAQRVAVEVEGGRDVDTLAERERDAVRLRVHWGGYGDVRWGNCLCLRLRVWAVE